MSETMTPIPFERMLPNLIKEYKKTKRFFDVPVSDNRSKAPIGLAAGPHTQLAGNILAGYAAGANDFELKTVQVLQGEALGIIKPCIDVGCEVYNTEWSTELKISEARDEYIKAYLLISVLSKLFHLKPINEIHFIASVGYDLKGIQSEVVDDFLESMKHASCTQEWQKDIAYIKQYYKKEDEIISRKIKADPKDKESVNVPEKDGRVLEQNELVAEINEEVYSLSLEEITEIEANDVIADTVTLSTMHGCPKEEIKEIVAYLLKEKKMNTFIKLNPTLLGKERIGGILAAKGYEHIEVAGEIFEVDMAQNMALELIKELKQTASKEHKIFGIKLTNTLPVRNKRGHLMGETMYLSGKPLYPIAIETAVEIAKRLDEYIPISYSGGIDLSNISQVLHTGIAPITVSSLILKPGGYRNLTKLMEAAKESSLEVESEKLNIDCLEAAATEAISNKAYDYHVPRAFTLNPDYTSECGKCNNCVDICPNRANIAGTLDGKRYVIHLDALCNECGACKCECIMGHEPYKEKLTIYTDKESFEQGIEAGVFYDGKHLITREGFSLSIPEKQLIELIQSRI